MRLYANRILAFVMTAVLAHPCLSKDSTQEIKWTYKKTNNPRDIEIKDNQQFSLNCRLDTEIERTALSFDEATLIISENAYLKTMDLQRCDQAKPTVYFTPEDNGMLVDFNLKTNIYISLLFVATRPMSYVAYIGKIGRKKNLVNLPGSYSNRKTIGKMQQEAFNYSDEFLSRPKISLNGHYVAPAGDVDCSAQSHPGVWDIEKNKKVIFPQTATSTAECVALFDK